MSLSEQQLAEIEARNVAERKSCNRNGAGPIGCDACDSRDWLSDNDSLTRVLADLKEARRCCLNDNTFIVPESAVRAHLRSVVYVDDKSKLVSASVQP